MADNKNEIDETNDETENVVENENEDDEEETVPDNEDDENDSLGDNDSGALVDTGSSGDGSSVATQDGGVRPLPPENAEQAQPRIGGWPLIKTLAIRMFIIYCISSLFRRGQTPTPGPSEGGPEGAVRSVSMQAANVFQKNSLMDMYIYVTETEMFQEYNDANALFWMVEELEYGDWTGGIFGDGIFTRSGQLTISENVQNNGTLYIHVFVVKTGLSPNPADSERYNKMYTIYKSRPLTKIKKRRYHMMKNLLTGTSGVQADLVRQSNEAAFEIITHWHPNLTINLIDDHTPWVQGSVPSPLDEYVDFLPGNSFYYPVLYFNDYWNLNSEYMPINSTTPVLNLTLTYQPLSLFKWQMYAAQGMRSRWYSFMGDDVVEGSDEDQDSLKQAFLETSPYLLAITVIVSIVHSVFEFLAFKNDIQFWRNRKSLEGLSVRSVFFNVFQSVVVLLYVLDNETNFVIKVSIFVGLAIEIWKIQKVIDIKVDRENKLFGILPRVWFQDKSTYTQSETKKYDMMAFKYLSWALFPLLACYAVYSVIYLEHKGWYSWLLGMIYGFLLTFGFIAMTPQLFINYKLKSVAHLPWRMLTYKALNTFIDDLFAFVIKMPMLYRLGCFRDDIVFLIYVYQRWIYRIDPKRVNEFGVSGDMLDGKDVTQNGVAGAIEGSPPAVPVPDGAVKDSPATNQSPPSQGKSGQSAAKHPKSKADKKRD